MTTIKILLGLIAAVILLVGGFTAGTFIALTRAASAPAQPFAQPTFVSQQQFQATAVSQQPRVTPVPQTTPHAIPPQGQWGRGWWMMDPNYIPQGDWEHGWMMNPNFVPQGQQGWGMHDWNDNDRGGMHGDMMNGHGWQTNPNLYPTPATPNNSTYYPTPSARVSFKDEVQPIFATRCVSCHGGTNGLYLDTYENILKGGNNGAVIIPGDVYNSRLAYYVYSGYMPYRNTPLTSVEIQTILDWISTGAPNN